MARIYAVEILTYRGRLRKGRLNKKMTRVMKFEICSMSFLLLNKNLACLSKLLFRRHDIQHSLSIMTFYIRNFIVPLCISIKHRYAECRGTTAVTFDNIWVKGSYTFSVVPSLSNENNTRNSITQTRHSVIPGTNTQTWFIRVMYYKT
jgi:hypothetical protein